MTQTMEELPPPSNIEAEQAVLGSAMLSLDALADITNRLKKDDFYRPAHQEIFEIAHGMYSESVPVDPLTVMDALLKRSRLSFVGGADYLHTLTAVVPTTANAGYYADMVRETAVRRRFIEAGTRLVSYGHSHEDIDVVSDAAMAEVQAATESRSNNGGPMALGQALQTGLDQIEQFGKGFMGLRTGFTDLDGLLNGLRGGQVVVVGARPAMGKSTFSLDIARQVAKDGETAVVFSLEMSTLDIVTRFLSAEARVSMRKINSGQMDEDEWMRVARRVGEVGSIPLFIDDSAELTMNEIRTRARRLKRECGLSLIVVDYLQLLETDSRSENRQLEVSKISRAMKMMAKELDVTVILVSQLNRGPEQRADKRPLLSDLRESGSVEQDADMVILLYRDDAYNRESASAGEAELNVAKHRNGETAIITVAFQGHYSRFVDMARRSPN